MSGHDAVLFDEIAGDHAHDAALRPRPLSEASAGALIRQRLGEEVTSAFSVACHAATGGNPLLLDELSKALAAEGVRPDSAHVGMVADLGPHRRVPFRAATTATVTGGGARGWRGPPPFSATELISESSLRWPVSRSTRSSRAASALVQAEILRPGEPIAFVHPLVRGAVYADLPPLGRAVEHERAAALPRPEEHRPSRWRLISRRSRATATQVPSRSSLSAATRRCTVAPPRARSTSSAGHSGSHRHQPSGLRCSSSSDVPRH